MIQQIRSKTRFIILLALSLSLVSCGPGFDRKKAQENREAVVRELQFGRLLAIQILKKYPRLEDKKANLYVSKVGKSVALFAGRSDIEYHFSVLDSEAINAFAAPGGYVFITKGALKAMRNEAELAGVLAHEIGHINYKHIIKQLPPPRETGGFVERMAAVLSAQGTVVSSAFSQVVKEASKVLFEKGYKIRDEYEADRAATDYLAATGYPPAALGDFLGVLQKIKEKEGKKEVYHTHPPPRDRIGKIQEVMEKEQYTSKGKPYLEKRYQENLAHLLKKG